MFKKNKKNKNKVGPHGELRKYCKYSEPVTANSGVAVKKGAQMRLKRDVWSGEIFSCLNRQKRGWMKWGEAGGEGSRR